MRAALSARASTQELDEVKSDMTNGKQLIAELEAREREATGIPKLRVGYNRVFGYYLEVLERV